MLGPGQQPAAEVFAVDVTASRQQDICQQQCLLGVVGYRPGGKSGSDYVIGRRFAETIDYAKVCGNVRARQHLGRHAERVADRKTVQGAAGTLAGRAHVASEARTVSTSVTSIIGL